MTLSTRGILSLGYVAALFLFRPAALGQNFASIGLALVLALAAAHLVLMLTCDASMASSRRLLKEIGFVAIISAVFLGYEFAVSAAFGQTRLDFQFKDGILAITVIACYGTFLVHPDNNRIFFDQLTSIVSLLGWSSLATLLLAQFIDLSLLEVYRFRMEGYEGDGPVTAGTIYFPFSMVYAIYEGDDFVLIRFNSFLREAGIYQAIAAFCYVLASLRGRSLLIRSGLIIGIISAFSTIGVAMLFIAIAAVYFLKQRLTAIRLAAAALFAALGLIAAVYAPGIGLAAKAENAASSLNDRTTAIQDGMRDVARNPLGYGQFRSGQGDSEINLLAGIGSIGIIGFLLQVMLLSGWRGQGDRRAFELMAVCLPVLLTALVSQPIAGSAMVYVLMMVTPRNQRSLPGLDHDAKRLLERLAPKAVQKVIWR